MLAVIADRWDATLGGRERYAEDLVAHLRAGGRQVTKAVRGDRMSRDITRILALTPVREVTHYQLHSGLAGRAFAAERASMPSAVRRALYPWAQQLNRARQRTLREEAQVLAGGAALMVFSASDARELVNRHRLSRDRVMLSRPGVNLRLFHPPCAARVGRGTRRLRFVFVGHNFALKGLRHAIRAIAAAAHEGVDVELTVAGRGRRGPYVRAAAAVGIGDRVSFAGALTQEQIANLYRSADALLHPTFYDPFPRAVIEALACGCPVITTQMCGAAEILTSGSDGFVVDGPGAISEIAAATAQLANPAILRQMRNAAAETGRRFDDVTHFRATAQWLFETR